MGYVVILAEKKSVAENIASTLKATTKHDNYFEGNGFLVCYAMGHLLELYDGYDYIPEMKVWKEEHFPFIPKQFKYKIIDGRYKLFNTIKTLFNRPDVDKIVSALDSDREGAAISWLLTKYTGAKKPIFRLLLNEWTPTEIIKGMNNLKPISSMKNIEEAGITRQWIDFLIISNSIAINGVLL
jgi:DNA topoisomerase III